MLLPTSCKAITTGIFLPLNFVTVVTSGTVTFTFLSNAVSCNHVCAKLHSSEIMVLPVTTFAWLKPVFIKLPGTLGFASDGEKKFKPKLVKFSAKVLVSPLVNDIVGLDPLKFAILKSPADSAIEKSGL